MGECNLTGQGGGSGGLRLDKIAERTFELNTSNNPENKVGDTFQKTYSEHSDMFALIVDVDITFPDPSVYANIQISNNPNFTVPHYSGIGKLKLRRWFPVISEGVFGSSLNGTIGAPAYIQVVGCAAVVHQSLYAVKLD